MFSNKGDFICPHVLVLTPGFYSRRLHSLPSSQIYAKISFTDCHPNFATTPGHSLIARIRYQLRNHLAELFRYPGVYPFQCIVACELTHFGHIRVNGFNRNRCICGPSYLHCGSLNYCIYDLSYVIYVFVNC